MSKNIIQMAHEEINRSFGNLAVLLGGIARALKKANIKINLTFKNKPILSHIIWINKHTLGHFRSQ